MRPLSNAFEYHLYVNREFSRDAVVWSAHMEPKDLMYLKFLEEFNSLKPRGR